MTENMGLMMGRATMDKTEKMELLGMGKRMDKTEKMGLMMGRIKWIT